MIFLLFLFFCVVNSKSTPGLCREIETPPRFEHIEFEPTIEERHLKLLVSYPIYTPRLPDGNQTSRGGVLKDKGVSVVTCTSSMPFHVDSTCSASTKFFLDPTEPNFIQQSHEMSIEYSGNITRHNYKYMVWYNFVERYLSKPASYSVDTPAFNIYDVVDDDVKGKLFYFNVKYNQYFDLSFKGTLTGFETEMEIIEPLRTVDEYYYEMNVLAHVKYTRNYPFEKDTFFFLVNDISFATDISIVRAGYATTTPVSSEHSYENITEVDGENDLFDVNVAHPNIVRGSLSVSEFGSGNITTVKTFSTKDKIQIVLDVVPEEFFTANEFIISTKIMASEIVLECTYCEGKRIRTYIAECQNNNEDYYDCLHHGISSHEDLNTNVTLNLYYLPAGDYKIVGNASVLVTFYDGSEKTISLFTYSRIFVSKMRNPQSYLEYVIITLISTLGLFTTTAGIGIGLFVMRVAQGHSQKHRFYSEAGGTRAVDHETGETFPLLVMNYNLRHKDLSFNKEEKDLLSRSFEDIYKLQKASKYTPYVHCKHCYLEQKEREKQEHRENNMPGIIGEDGAICIKCGLPLLQYVAFGPEDTFCVICAMLNKYQPRPHGRCLLHVSALSRDNGHKKSLKRKVVGVIASKTRKQGAVYVLYRDLFSIGSISRQIRKKSKKKEWIERITKDQVWKLNSLMRFEYINLVRDLIHKELIHCESRQEYEESVVLLRKVREKVMDRMNEIGRNMKSDFFKRLKIDFKANNSFFSDREIEMFCDNFRKTLLLLIASVSRHIQFLEDQKANTGSGRKRKRIADLLNWFSGNGSPNVEDPGSRGGRNFDNQTSTQGGPKRMKNISGSMVSVKPPSPQQRQTPIRFRYQNGVPLHQYGRVSPQLPIQQQQMRNQMNGINGPPPLPQPTFFLNHNPNPQRRPSPPNHLASTTSTPSPVWDGHRGTTPPSNYGNQEYMIKDDRIIIVPPPPPPPRSTTSTISSNASTSLSHNNNNNNNNNDNVRNGMKIFMDRLIPADMRGPTKLSANDLSMDFHQQNPSRQFLEDHILPPPPDSDQNESYGMVHVGSYGNDNNNNMNYFEEGENSLSPLTNNNHLEEEEERFNETGFTDIDPIWDQDEITILDEPGMTIEHYSSGNGNLQEDDDMTIQLPQPPQSNQNSEHRSDHSSSNFLFGSDQHNEFFLENEMNVGDYLDSLNIVDNVI